MHGRGKREGSVLWGCCVAAVLALRGVAAGCGDDDDEGDACDGRRGRSERARRDRGASGYARSGDGAADADQGRRSCPTARARSASFYEARHRRRADCRADPARARPTNRRQADATASTARPSPAARSRSSGYGCADDTADKAIEETRRLVEQLGAEILIGPLSGDEGIAVANYAQGAPEVTFVNGTSGAQDTTLKVQAPNFFRFNSDGAQWSAGLGDYAYNTLGWRTAGDHRRRLLVPVHVARRLHRRVLRARRRGRVARVAGARRDRLLVVHLADPGGRRRCHGRHRRLGPDHVHQAVRAGRGKIDGKKFMGNVFWPDPLVLEEIGDQLEGGVAAGPTGRRLDRPGGRRLREAHRRGVPGRVARHGLVGVHVQLLNALEALLAGARGRSTATSPTGSGAPRGRAGGRHARRAPTARSRSTRTARRSPTTTSSRSSRPTTATA